jgi:hypothetical protein
VDGEDVDDQSPYTSPTGVRGDEEPVCFRPRSPPGTPGRPHAGGSE